MAAKLGTVEPPSMGYALGLAQQKQAAPTVVSAQQAMRKRAKAKTTGPAKKVLKDEKAAVNQAMKATALLAGSAVKDATGKDTMQCKANQEVQSKLKANDPKATCAKQAKVEAKGMEQKTAGKGANNQEDEQCAKKRPNKTKSGESDHPGKRLKQEMDLPSVPDPYKEENELLPAAARVPQEQRSGRHSYTLACPGHLGTLASKITVLPGAQRRLRCVAWVCGACMGISQCALPHNNTAWLWHSSAGKAHDAAPYQHGVAYSKVAQQGLLHQAQLDR
jgi:hypothetical protein